MLALYEDEREMATTIQLVSILVPMPRFLFLVSLFYLLWFIRFPHCPRPFYILPATSNIVSSHSSIFIVQNILICSARDGVESLPSMTRSMHCPLFSNLIPLSNCEAGSTISTFQSSGTGLEANRTSRSCIAVGHVTFHGMNSNSLREKRQGPRTAIFRNLIHPKLPVFPNLNLHPWHEKAMHLEKTSSTCEKHYVKKFWRKGSMFKGEID